jgi:putative ABC transport system ATP-binding protein
MPAEPAASCTDLVKIYWTPTGEVHALKGVDAAFPPGTITAVVGPSGSGKSSLLRILAGMDQPTAGQCAVGGTQLAGASARTRRAVRRTLVGYVFQRPSENLIPYLTVDEHVRMAARLRRADRRQGGELLELLGIAERRHHRPAQLSGGEQQRVAFARAVVGDPPLVVADEPTAQLDAASARALLERVRILAGRGASMVIATHDPLVVSYADRTIYLRHGTLEAEAVRTAPRDGEPLALDRAAGEADREILAVIDASGRIQLPPELAKLFPTRRARLGVEGDRVWISPP